MDIQVKKYADARDLKSLKYIFADALDVDPTFARYEEEYNYCKAIPGLLEPHIELTPFVQDTTCWDENYWASLKTDLVKNFSDRRMMHMKEVAQVFLAEKIQRILAERSAAAVPTIPAAHPVNEENKPEIAVIPTTKTSGISRSEQEKRDLDEAKRKLERENRKIEAERQAKARQLEQQKALYHEDSTISTGDSSKKAVGVAVVALAVAAVLLVLLLK